MSRVEFENKEWMIAVGVDGYTSSFLQVWVQPHDDQDEAIAIIDNRGVMAGEESSSTPGPFKDLLEDTRQRFEYSRRHGNSKPNLDAATMCRMAKALGFDEDVAREIYRILD